MSSLRRLVFVLACGAAAIVWPASPVLAGDNGWHVGYLTPSSRTLSMSSAGTPATGLASFDFTSSPSTSLLVTSQGSSSVLGNDTGKTVTATFAISGATPGSFFYDTTNNSCGTPANVRLFFETSNSGGFDETHYWWSNPESMTLADGSFTLTAPLDGSMWSDFFGHFGSDTSYSAGFNSAVANVTTIGLSFGGGCFFENGVGITDGSGTLTLDSFDVS